MQTWTTWRMARNASLAGVLAMLTLLAPIEVAAQELVRIPTIAPNAGRDIVEGSLAYPSSADAVKPFPAVILLHAGGGWEVPVTGQYATALNRAGFVTLELRLFRNEAERAPSRMGYLQNLYDALRFLGEQKDVNADRVSVAGYSFGGILALTSATSWAYERFARSTGPRFAAHAPFYPICYQYAAFARAGRPTADLPADLLARWTGAPVRIFAGGRDDYDDRDPRACEEFVSLIPEPNRAKFSVTVYSDATHGWDQPNATFFEKLACKGRGCTNRNVASPSITERSVADLVAFLAAFGR
ncbi:dienelactone hydrolase family protein [Ideonella sp.]|uniref:dienelactone hydrolase family protein n=1 Tax=Ideonella sp. TaxID=1929293 RepID=UPI0035B2978F